MSLGDWGNGFGPMDRRLFVGVAVPYLELLAQLWNGACRFRWDAKEAERPTIRLGPGHMSACVGTKRMSAELTSRRPVANGSKVWPAEAAERGKDDRLICIYNQL